MQWKPGHGLFAIRDAGLYQPRARGVEIGCGERDVIEVSRIVVRGVLPADQMQDGALAKPEPRAGKVEWRSIAIDEAQRIGSKYYLGSALSGLALARLSTGDVAGSCRAYADALLIMAFVVSTWFCHPHCRAFRPLHRFA